VNENIENYAHGLHLSYLRRNYGQLAIEAEDSREGYEAFIERILATEMEQRRITRLSRRVKDAGFPTRKLLSEFETGHYDRDLRGQIERLASLSFIERNENAIMIGNPGTGKTHLAVALGMEACLRDMSVLFTNIPNLVVEMREAMSASQLTTYRKKFEKYSMVILDELGYITFDRSTNEMLFNLLANRTGAGSIVITTNLGFDRWNEVFGDPVLTTALVDRLAHKAHVLDMSGESYRIRETRTWIESQRRPGVGTDRG
jgi:DNA replication protein DnaC